MLSHYEKRQSENLLIDATDEPPIDVAIADSFREIHPNDVYARLTVRDNGRKSSIKDAWHNGKSADLSAQDVDIDALRDEERQLLAWKNELIANNNIDSTVKKLYRWKVNEDIANTRMTIASSVGDNRAFRRYNEFIYGAPNEDIYRAALDFVGNDAERIIKECKSDESIVAAQRVLDQLDDKRGDRRILSPNEETFNKVREDHWRRTGYFGLLLAGVNVPDGAITPDIGDPILEHILKNNLKSSYNLVHRSGSWEVAHEAEELRAPNDYFLSRERFIGLPVGHEGGTHILEKENGRRSLLQLMGVGLDRQENGGEGRAIVREQVAYKSFEEFTGTPRWRDIIRRHIAISYAYGLEGREMESSEVYQFMNTIDEMYKISEAPDNPNKAKTEADKATDNLLLRVLKGTDGKGGAYLKDKVYLEGNVAAWVMAARHGADIINDGDLGKYDISNSRHITELQELGLLPSYDTMESII